MAIEYAGDEDPRKIKAAQFFAGQAEAARASMANPDAGDRLGSMLNAAQRIARSVRRRGKCTDKQLKALENIATGVRKFVHGGDA